MVNSSIVPLALLVKYIHLLGNLIGIDHVKVECVVLLEPESPRSAPVVIGGDGDDLLNGDPVLLHTAESQHMHLQVASVGIELHLQHEMLSVHARLDEEWNQAEELCFVLRSEHFISEVAAGSVRELLELGRVVNRDGGLVSNSY